MSAHPDVLRLARADDEARLDPVERERLLRHVSDCPRCRAALAEQDPTRLFGILALDPFPEGLLERLSRNVESAVAEFPRRRSNGRFARSGSIAASLLLAGLFGAYLWTGSDAEPANAALQEPGPAPLRGGAAVPGLPAAVESAERIELLGSPGSAQILDLRVGDTQLFMIFDKALDI